MYYFTVGPTQLYPIVPRALTTALKQNIPSLSHRSSLYQSLHEETVMNLKLLLKIPSSYSVFFLSSGTEAMERIIQNTVQRHSYHLVNGSFSDRFYQTALELGKKPYKTEVAYGASFNWNDITIPPNTEVLCATHNETSTGVMLELEKLYFFKKRHPHMLLALDTVSSMPYVEVNFSQVDMTFFSVQKGFGMPAGLGILVVSPAALVHSSGSYHSFASLSAYANKHQTPETPNVLGIYIFNQVLKHMIKQGIDTIRSDIEIKSQSIEAFVFSSQAYEYLVQDPAIRSKTIHVLKVTGGSQSIISRLKHNGYEVSAGYGGMKSDYIRIGNFPAHHLQACKKLLHLL